jgi:alpha-glucosidase
MDFGFVPLDSKFLSTLNEIYRNAKSKGRWENTYAIANLSEYWSEGVQTFFAANLEATPANGIHNSVNTPEELATYDPEFYEFLVRYWGKPKFRWFDLNPARNL